MKIEIQIKIVHLHSQDETMNCFPGLPTTTYPQSEIASGVCIACKISKAF